MGNKNSSPQKIDVVVDIPVCFDKEKSIHAHSIKQGSHNFKYEIKYPELTCHIAVECLKGYNLPVSSGTVGRGVITGTPSELKPKFDRIHQCVKSKINHTPRSQAFSSVQSRPPPPPNKVPAAKTETQIQEAQRVAISTLCDGQSKHVPPPPPGSIRPRISKDGFYIYRGGGPGDFIFISVELDNLTCKEALNCMNKLELSFDGTEGSKKFKRYRDTKNRTVNELQNSIRNQCVNAPTPPGPSPPPPSPPSTDDATEVDDFMGMGVSQNVVLIGFCGAMMAAAALSM